MRAHVPNRLRILSTPTHGEDSDIRGRLFLLFWLYALCKPPRFCVIRWHQLRLTAIGNRAGHPKIPFLLVLCDAFIVGFFQAFHDSPYHLSPIRNACLQYFRCTPLGYASHVREKKHGSDALILPLP